MKYKLYLSVNNTDNLIIVGEKDGFYMVEPQCKNAIVFRLLAKSAVFTSMSNYNYEIVYESNDIIEFCKEVKAYFISCYDTSCVPWKNLNSSIEKWKSRRKLIILQ